MLLVNLLILNLPADSESPVKFTLQGKAPDLGSADIPNRMSCTSWLCVCMYCKSLDMMGIGTHSIGSNLDSSSTFLSILWLSKDIFTIFNHSFIS